MIAGAQFAYDLIREGYASDNLDWEAAHVLFDAGQAPFIITGPNAKREVSIRGGPRYG